MREGAIISLSDASSSPRGVSCFRFLPSCRAFQNVGIPHRRGCNAGLAGVLLPIAFDVGCARLTLQDACERPFRVRAAVDWVVAPCGRGRNNNTVNPGADPKTSRRPAPEAAGVPLSFCAAWRLFLWWEGSGCLARRGRLLPRRRPLFPRPASSRLLGPFLGGLRLLLWWRGVSSAVSPSCRKGCALLPLGPKRVTFTAKWRREWDCVPVSSRQTRFSVPGALCGDGFLPCHPPPGMFLAGNPCAPPSRSPVPGERGRGPRREALLRKVPFPRQTCS